MSAQRRGSTHARSTTGQGGREQCTPAALFTTGLGRVADLGGGKASDLELVAVVVEGHDTGGFSVRVDFPGAQDADVPVTVVLHFDGSRRDPHSSLPMR